MNLFQDIFVKSRGRWMHTITISSLIAIVSVSTGCRTPSNVIPSTELPLSYRAQNRMANPDVDLSVLARKSLNNDLIYPGDVLDVTLRSGAEETPPEPMQSRVLPTGEIVLPLIGAVQVAGMTMTGAEDEIRRIGVERQIYRSPIVSVLLKNRQSDLVRVVGAVNEPGVYELPRASSDLLAALVKAKGLTEDAGTLIEIRHPAIPSSELTPAAFEDAAEASSQTVQVDLSKVTPGESSDLSLRDGSVVMVKKYRPQTVYVHGLVKQAGEYELPKDKPLRVDQAIALASGRESEFADTVHVTRILDDRNDPLVIGVSLKEAKANRDANIVLMPGDVVSVEETPTTFSIEFLRNFFRIGFSIPGF